MLMWELVGVIDDFINTINQIRHVVAESVEHRLPIGRSDQFTTESNQCRVKLILAATKVGVQH